jgi:hypothetical protein
LLIQGGGLPSSPHPTSYLLPSLVPLNPLLFVYPRRCCRLAIWPVLWLREAISMEVVLTAVGEMTGEGGGGGGGGPYSPTVSVVVVGT